MLKLFVPTSSAGGSFAPWATTESRILHKQHTAFFASQRVEDRSA